MAIAPPDGGRQDIGVAPSSIREVERPEGRVSQVGRVPGPFVLLPDRRFGGVRGLCLPIPIAASRDVAAVPAGRGRPWEHRCRRAVRADRAPCAGLARRDLGDARGRVRGSFARILVRHPRPFSGAPPRIRGDDEAVALGPKIPEVRIALDRLGRPVGSPLARQRGPVDLARNVGMSQSRAREEERPPTLISGIIHLRHGALGCEAG